MHPITEQLAIWEYKGHAPMHAVSFCLDEHGHRCAVLDYTDLKTLHHTAYHPTRKEALKELAELLPEP